MKALLFLILSMIGSANALAAIDPRFTYEAAAAAFNAASPVDHSILVGKWRVIGIAQSNDWEQVDSGYWPNGQCSVEGSTEHYYHDLSFANAVDGFGRDFVLEQEKIINVRTGAVVRSTAHAAQFTPRGVAMDYVNQSTSCRALVECRFVKSNSMLLCAATINDDSLACQRYQSANVIQFEGSIKR